MARSSAHPPRLLIDKTIGRGKPGFSRAFLHSYVWRFLLAHKIAFGSQILAREQRSRARPPGRPRSSPFTATIDKSMRARVERGERGRRVADPRSIPVPR